MSDRFPVFSRVWRLQRLFGQLWKHVLHTQIAIRLKVITAVSNLLRPIRPSIGTRRERTTVLRVRRNLWTDKLFLLFSFRHRLSPYFINDVRITDHIISYLLEIELGYSEALYSGSTLFLMSFANCILYLGIYFCSLFYFTKIIICLFFSLSFHLEIITIRTGSRRLWTSRVTRDID